MRQNRKQRKELLNKLRNKLSKKKTKGESGVVSLNVKKPKRPKIVKEKSVLEVIKTSRPKEEKELNTPIGGTVKWFSAIKGFGFIKGTDSQDYFIHHSQVDKKTILSEGDEVLFNASKSPKGLKTVNITKQE